MTDIRATTDPLVRGLLERVVHHLPDSRDLVSGGFAVTPKP